MIGKLFELVGIIKIVFANHVSGHQGGGFDTSFPLPDPFSGHNFEWVVGKIADFLLVIGGPLVAIMILIGGFYMVTSGGSAERFSTGKKTILYAAIGFVVILAAKGVASVIQNIFQ